jgi:hypothetical protein
MDLDVAAFISDVLSEVWCVECFGFVSVVDTSGGVVVVVVVVVVADATAAARVDVTGVEWPEYAGRGYESIGGRELSTRCTVL